MIIAIIILLFVSLFFSGSETALTAINRMRLQTKANNDDIKSEKLLGIVSKPDVFITTILIGNNIANILLPTLVTMVALDYGINVAIASGILTIVIIIFAEVIPKSIAAAFPDRIAYLIYPIIRFFIILFKPLTILLNGMTGLIVRLLSRGDEDNNTISKEELRAMVDIAGTEGTFKKEESHRIKGVLDFYNLNVNDALKTPRVDVIALPLEASYEEVRSIVIRHPFTRYPVYEDGLDSIVGVFHSKFLIIWSMEPEKPLEEFTDMDPLIVYEFHSIELVFRKMMQEKKHMAIVLDEYGGTEGILTQEDIIEAMIGLEIEDETDLAGESLIEKLTETEIICNGKITLHRLNSLLHSDIPEEEDVLAAYLLKEFNYFPDEGEVLERDGLIFSILGVEGRTIKRVRIMKEIE
ncbi:hemolysin family protein [Ornithinibacillus salinisoli]|uniref:Hemolysin family protein n=1 Tax=Ornithinibacillus salinisoli TaxID=1848459 RepID=A0ABW4VWF1_9BACI